MANPESKNLAAIEKLQFKYLLKKKGISYKRLAEILGMKYTSVKNQLASSKPFLPKWAKSMVFTDNILAKKINHIKFEEEDNIAECSKNGCDIVNEFLSSDIHEENLKIPHIGISVRISKQDIHNDDENTYDVIVDEQYLGEFKGFENAMRKANQYMREKSSEIFRNYYKESVFTSL